jgi:hypothetical protein
MKENFQNNFTKILKSILGIGVVVIVVTLWTFREGIFL